MYLLILDLHLAKVTRSKTCMRNDLLLLIYLPAMGSCILQLTKLITFNNILLLVEYEVIEMIQGCIILDIQIADDLL